MKRGMKTEGGARFVAWRKHAGLTQADAPRRLGCTQTCIAGYESGRRFPGTRLTAMAELYGCAVDDLLGRTPDTPEHAMPATNTPLAPSAVREVGAVDARTSLAAGGGTVGEDTGDLKGRALAIVVISQQQEMDRLRAVLDALLRELEELRRARA